jgi:hypothetical protein
VADVGLIRKRLRFEIDAARRASAERRARTAAATSAYEQFLAMSAVPVFRQIANVLRAEGIPFEVQTPGQGVRLVSDRDRDDVIEIELDTTADPPQPTLISTRTRGSRVVRSESPIKPGAAIETLTEDDLIERLMQELRPWLG